ncbi:hypothetical protein JX580_08040 [Thiomicrospira microaerophila]|uniref:hypothetical protein n=1 Tax=Thiomicrospira microaerophila TaxID=406020 RepID=UPI0020103886|nr:hypothetical protein [Thiomicrospira microaerophila]UQB41623.1 hypothetical protein JX580_08040 [Thiomicrospira microaerophila]
MKRVFWLHDESLHRPKMIRPEDRWVFIWDQSYLNSQAWSFKRQVFLFESVTELAQQGCEVYQADTLSALQTLVVGQEIELVVQRAQDPLLQHLIEQVQQQFNPLSLQTPPGLVALGEFRPKRFFHYWKQVETSLLGDRQPSTHYRVR